VTATGPEPRLPRVVRPYVLTGGRTRAPGPTLALDATVCATASAPTRPLPAAPEASRIVELSVAPISVAELAGRLTLPVGVVRVLIGDLGSLGALRISDPTPIGAATDAGLLARLLDGIRAL
jgi:Protein of unknown function (DUF742)